MRASGTPPVKAATRQVSSPGDPTEGRAQAVRPPSRQDAIQPRSGGVREPPCPPPQRGEVFTEEQLREKFGLSPPCTGKQLREKSRFFSSDGIRTSKTSSDIILVSDVHGSYEDNELGKRIEYDGAYRRERSDQMIGPNLRLAKSRENGNRLLYFTKERDKFRFDCIVECVGYYDKDDPSRPGAVAFELEIVGAAAAAGQGGRAGRRTAGDSAGLEAARCEPVASSRHDLGRPRGGNPKPRLRAAVEARLANGAVTRQADSTRYAAVVSIAEDEDGGYVATVPALPGCISQGETRAQAQRNVEEAISLHLEYLLENGETLPPSLVAALDVAAVNVQGKSVSAQVSDMEACVPA